MFNETKGNWKNSEVVSIFANKYLPQLEGGQEDLVAEAEPVFEDIEQDVRQEEELDVALEELYSNASAERDYHQAIRSLEKIASEAAIEGCEKAAYMIE